MTKRPNDQHYYRDEFLFEYGITNAEQKLNYRKPGYAIGGEATINYFNYDKNGNIIIHYPTLAGSIAIHNDKGQEKASNRTRLRLPFKDKSGNEVKYLTEGNNNIFFPPQLLRSYKLKTEIPVLVVTEGEKKAFYAAKMGFDVVGISGIWNFMRREHGDNTNYQAELHPELQLFIKECKVQHVILLHDSDALDFSHSTTKPITHRPNNFYGAVKRFTELVFQEGCKVSYTYINPHLTDSKLGLDDLLLQYETSDQIVLQDFLASIKKREESQYFVTTRIHYLQEVFIKQIFLLNDPQEFYTYHKAKLKDRQEFNFNGKHYELNHTEGTVKEKKKDYIQNVWVQNGVYKANTAKRGEQIVSNFTMEVLFLLMSKQNPKRIVEFKNIEGQRFIDEFTMDDFTSVTSFRKRIEAHGNFMYFGDVFELMHLKNMLFSKEQTASELSTLGWHKNGGFWAFSNGLTNGGGWFPVNEYGILTYNKQSYYLPAFSNIYSDADEQYENERNFRHIESEVFFKQWSSLFVSVYKDNGFIGIAWAVAAIYRDIIFPEFKEFPILNLFGQKGGGKSTMAKSLMYLFGQPQPAISLENASSTKKGIYRKFSQFRNAFIWLDEYKNTIHPDLIGLCKNLYDGIGYERAQTSNDSRTNSLTVQSSTIISGQDMPTVDPALFTRVMLLQFKNNSFKPEDVTVYNELKALEKLGLTNIVIALIKHRGTIQQNFLKAYHYWFKEFSNDFKYKEVPDRLLKNAALAIAPVAILVENNVLDFPCSIKQLYAKFYDCIVQHAALLADNQEVSAFWNIIEILFSENKISAEAGHFKFIDDSIAIRFRLLYSAYAMHHRNMYGKAGLDQQTLLNYLKNTPQFVESKDNIRFSNTVSSAFIFHYKSLGINLVRLSQEKEMATAYKELEPEMPF